MANKDFQNGIILGSVAGGNIQTSTPSGNIDIIENDTYDVSQYATASVNVPSSGSPFPVAEYTFKNDYNGTSDTLYGSYVHDYLTTDKAYYYIDFTEGNDTGTAYIIGMFAYKDSTDYPQSFIRYTNGGGREIKSISYQFSAYVKAGTKMKVYTLG